MMNMNPAARFTCCSSALYCDAFNPTETFWWDPQRLLVVEVDDRDPIIAVQVSLIGCVLQIDGGIPILATHVVYLDDYKVFGPKPRPVETALVEKHLKTLGAIGGIGVDADRCRAAVRSVRPIEPAEVEALFA